MLLLLLPSLLSLLLLLLLLPLLLMMMLLSLLPLHLLQFFACQSFGVLFCEEPSFERREILLFALCLVWVP